MKNVVKQPFFLIACASFLLAICIAVISGISQPKVPVLEKLEKGMNKRKLETVLSCFPPEERALYSGLAALGGSFEDLFGDAEKVNIIYSEPVEDENGNISVIAAVLDFQDGMCVDAEVEKMELVESDGELYLSGF